MVATVQLETGDCGESPLCSEPCDLGQVDLW